VLGSVKRDIPTASTAQKAIGVGSIFVIDSRGQVAVVSHVSGTQGAVAAGRNRPEG